MKFMRLILVGALLALPMSVQADPEPAAPAATEAPAPANPAAALDTNKDGKVDAKEVAAATEAEADMGDVVADGSEAVSEITKVVKNKDSMPTGTIILIILGVVFKLLLSTIKVLGRNIAWFKTKDGKRVVKYSTLGLGAAAGLVANLAFGMHWIEAVQIILSGPLAVAIHEYTKDSKDTPAEADA